MAERPTSKRVLRLFAEADALARQLSALMDREDKLLDELEQVSRWKSTVMAQLADKSREASLAEVEEILRRSAR